MDSKNMENIGEKHRNDIALELSLYPDNSVYIVLNKDEQKVMVSVVRNGVAWIARQVQEIKMGVHKCGTNAKDILILPISSPYSDMVSLGIVRSDLCKQYRLAGLTVYASKSSKLKVRYIIKKRLALLQIVNSRNRVIGQMNFDSIPLAKAFAKDKTMLELLQALKENKNDKT